jgi:hypothetical protein
MKTDGATSSTAKFSARIFDGRQQRHTAPNMASRRSSRPNFSARRIAALPIFLSVEHVWTAHVKIHRPLRPRRTARSDGQNNLPCCDVSSFAAFLKAVGSIHGRLGFFPAKSSSIVTI